MPAQPPSGSNVPGDPQTGSKAKPAGQASSTENRLVPAKPKGSHTEEVSVSHALEGAARAPVVIDLGSISRKDLKRLRRGEGPAMDEVRQAASAVRASAAADAPLVVLYRKKRRRTGGRFPLPFPFPFS